MGAKYCVRSINRAGSESWEREEWKWKVADTCPSRSIKYAPSSSIVVGIPDNREVKKFGPVIHMRVRSITTWCRVAARFSQKAINKTVPSPFDNSVARVVANRTPPMLSRTIVFASSFSSLRGYCSNILGGLGILLLLPSLLQFLLLLEAGLERRFNNGKSWPAELSSDK